MARKTILVCDNCGKEVPESRGAVMRLNYTDARRGSKQADLCDDCAARDARPGGRTPRPPAEVGRDVADAVGSGPAGLTPSTDDFPRSLHRVAEARTKARPRPGLRWTDGSLARRRAGSRRQGRAASGALLDVLERDPWLVVPNRVDVDRVERDLIRRRPALLAGTIGTFDDLFRAHRRRRPRRAGPSRRIRSARSPSDARSRARELDDLALRRPRRRASRTPCSRRSASSSRRSSTRTGSTATSPQLVDAYRDELERARLCAIATGSGGDAVERLRGDLDAWGGAPVFAYGFEDLTGAEWALLEALAARTEVTVSIPYEPGRAAFAALERTVEDLAGLAGGAIEELPRRRSGADRRRRSLTSNASSSPTTPAPGPSLDGAIRFLEGAGTRGTVELLASEVAALLRGGTRSGARRASSASPSIAGARRSRRRSRSSRFRYAVEHGRRLGDTPLGRALALAAPLRVARGQSRRPLRVPALAVLGARASLRRLRRGPPPRPGGRGAGARVEEESERLRGAPVPALVELQGRRAIRSLRRGRLVRTDDAERLGARVASDDRRRRDRCARRTERPSGRSTSSQRSRPRRRRRRRRTTCSPRSSERGSLPRARREGRVAVLDHERARTRAFDVVFVLGLEEGAFPRRARPSPLLSDELRRELGGRLERPDSVARDRYLFYTTCTRASQRLVLVREAAGDEGVPREPSPFWEDVRSLFDDGRRAARDPSTAALGSHVAARVGAERARAPARARPARSGRRRTARLRSRRRTTGRVGSIVRAAPSIARRRLAKPGRRSSRSRRRRSSRRRSSSASPTARRPGSSSA